MIKGCGGEAQNDVFLNAANAEYSLRVDPPLDRNLFQFKTDYPVTSTTHRGVYT